MTSEDFVDCVELQETTWLLVRKIVVVDFGFDCTRRFLRFCVVDESEKLFSTDFPGR